MLKRFIRLIISIFATVHTVFYSRKLLRLTSSLHICTTIRNYIRYHKITIQYSKHSVSQAMNISTHTSAIGLCYWTNV